MKDYGHLKLFLIIAFIIGLTTLFAGCGGGNSDVTTSPVINNNQTAASGSFAITVNIPKPDKNLVASYIPYTRKTLAITITGEAIPTSSPIEDSLDLDEGNTLTVSGIPVGLNVASIKILDSTKKVIAQRTVGFFLKGNERYTAGSVDMGVGIDSSGSCIPSTMEIPKGTEIFFENQDPNTEHTVSFNNGEIVLGPIAKVQTSTDPNTPIVFDAKSYKFDKAGTYVYDTGKGGPGQISVFDIPSVTSIDNGNIDPNMKNRDELQVNSDFYFTLTGSGFGNNRTEINGKVIFTQVDPLIDANEITKIEATFDSNSTWTDTSIKAKIKISEGTYLVQASVRGGLSTEKIYYYRSTIHQLGDMKFSIGQIADLFMTVNKETVGGANYGVPYLAYNDKNDSTFTHTYSRYDFSKGQWERKYYNPPDPPNEPDLLGMVVATGSASFLKFSGTDVKYYSAVIFSIPANDTDPPVAIPEYRQLFITYNGEEYIPVSPFPTIKQDPNSATKYYVSELWDVNEVSITVDDNDKLYVAYTMKNNGKDNTDFTKYNRCYTSIYDPTTKAIQPKTFHNEELFGTFRTSYVSNINAGGYSAKVDFKGLSGYGDVSIVRLKIDKNRKFLSFKDGPNQNGVTVMTDYEAVDGDDPSVFTEPLVSGTKPERYPLDWDNGTSPYPVANTWRVVGKEGFSRKEASGISVDVYNHIPYVVFRDSNTNGLSLMKYTAKYSYSDYSGVPTGWQVLGKEGFASGSEDVSLSIYNYVFGNKGIPYVAYSDSKGHLMKYEYTTDEFKGIWSELGHVTGFSDGTCSPLSLFVYDDNSIPVPFLGYQDQTINQTGTVKKFKALPIDPNDVNNY